MIDMASASRSHWRSIGDLVRYRFVPSGRRGLTVCTCSLWADRNKDSTGTVSLFIRPNGLEGANVCSCSTCALWILSCQSGQVLADPALEGGQVRCCPCSSMAGRIPSYHKASALPEALPPAAVSGE